MNVSKKLTSKSGITIPKHLRHEIGFVPGMAVDLETTHNGVLIKKHSPTCRFCGRTENIITVAQIDMCTACAKALAKEVAEHVGG